MEKENAILTTWAELKTLVEVVEKDLEKNVKGTASAGVRARKGLRVLKKQASTLVNLTKELTKERKAAKTG